MKVLICIDLGEAAKFVLEESKKLLQNFIAPELYILNVMDISSLAMGQGYDSTLLVESMKHEADSLKEIATTILGDIHFDFSAEMGYATDEILRKAAAIHCDLLIMGTHGRTGLDHLLMGSVAEKTLRLSKCNTLIIPVNKNSHLGA